MPEYEIVSPNCGGRITPGLALIGATQSLVDRGGTIVAHVKSKFVSNVIASRLVPPEQVAECQATLEDPSDERKLTEAMVRRGLLTRWQITLLQEGRTQGFFLEHYKILEPLGSGGMGQIFRALDIKTGWHVAVKVLPKKSVNADSIRRFRREGQAALRVQHPHIVHTFHLGQHGDTFFLAMELVVGSDLSKHITRHGKLSVPETARIGYQVALALEHARSQGIIHRDVKPSNILLTLRGHVKLTDLGLAKFFGTGEEPVTDLTRSGAVLGTIDYMAPEQAEDARRADTRSDIYSLGCTLYKCLTGRTPFQEGTHVQKIISHRQEPPEPIRMWNSDVPEELANLIVQKMLAKSRADRFQTPFEVAAALAPWAKLDTAAGELTPLPGSSEPTDDADAATAEGSTDSQDEGPDPAQKYVTVTCSVCGTRLGATRSQFGTKLECPDCGTSLPVPWPKKLPKVEHPTPTEISTYGVLPVEPNPVVEPPSLDYDPLGPDRRPEVRGPTDDESLATGRFGWTGPVLILGGAVLGAGIVLAILALSGLLRLPSQQPPASSTPEVLRHEVPPDQR